MPLQVVFSFEENDNPPLADLFNVFVKVNVGRDISYADYLAFLQAVLKANCKYVPINALVRTDGVHESVNLEDILFIEVLHHTIIIHCKNKNIETSGSLTQMEERLSDYGFVRTHRHLLIPLDKIRRVEQDDIYIQNEAPLHIGKSYQKKIRAMIRERTL